MSTEDINDVIDEVNDLRSLIVHPGWRRYAQMVQEILDARSTRLFEPLENVLEATKQEFTKGECSAYATALALPSIKFNEGEALLEQYKEEQKNAEEEEDSTDAATGRTDIP